MDRTSDILRNPWDVISGNPKKIVVMTLVITLILAYFASNIDTSTDEGLFTPDTEKTAYMKEVEEKFGQAEDFVQVTHISQDQSFLTVDGLKMLLHLEEELKRDPSLSPILADSTFAEGGIYTPATSILTGIWLLDAEEELRTELGGVMTDLSDYSFSNQTRFYKLVLNSTEACTTLLQEDDPYVVGNATLFLSSKSVVMANGMEGWMPLLHYSETLEDSGMDLSDALDALDDDNVSKEEKITYLEFVVADMNMKSGSIPGLEHFANMLRSVKDIMVLDQEHPRDLADTALTMGVDLFRVTTIEIEEPPEMGDSMERESPEMDLQRKFRMLTHMGDDGLYQRYHMLMDYDPTELRAMVRDTVEQNARLKGELQEAESVILYLMENISRAEALTLYPENVQGYYDAMHHNHTIVNQAMDEIDEMNLILHSSKAMPEAIGGICRMLDMTYVTDEGSEYVLSIVMISPPKDMDERVYAHQRVDVISNIVARDGMESRVFSSILMNEEINETTNRSLEILLPLGFLFVVILLIIIYRNAFEVMLSLISLGMAILWTLGIGVILGYSFNPFLIAVPILITGLVIDYGIHMVMRYREERGKGELPGVASKLTVVTVGGALVLTTLTTAVGFMSNVFMGIEVVRQFGILAAVGISSSFVIMVGFLPSVMRLLDERFKGKARGKKIGTSMHKPKNLFIRSTMFSAKKPLFTLLIVCLLTSIALYGVINVDTTFDMMDFLPQDSRQRENILFLQENFDVTSSYTYVMIEGDLTDPNFLYLLNRSIEEMEDSELLVTEWGVESPLSVLGTYGRATPLHPNYDPTFVEMYNDADMTGDGIPNANLSVLYDHLYQDPEARTDMQNVLLKGDDGEFTIALVKLPENAETLSSDLSNALILEDGIRSATATLHENYTVMITGQYMISYEATTVLREAQLTSLVVTLIVVLSMLSMVFYVKYKNLVLGLITTVPVVLVCVWIIGTMYLLGISLNVMTVTITALTVGMGVDYSIHVTHRFIEEREKNRGTSAVVSRTISSTGTALLGSATTTMVVFLLLSSSEIIPLAQFGLITALAILYSLVASLYILPALLSLTVREG